MTIKNVLNYLIAFIYGIGTCLVFIYPFVFLHWKIKTKHRMRFDIVLVAKWIAVFLFSTIPPFIIFGVVGHHEEVFKIVVFWLLNSSITYILYKFNLAKKYELPLALITWSPAVALMVYKKRQTELMLKESSKEGSDVCPQKP